MPPQVHRVGDQKPEVGLQEFVAIVGLSSPAPPPPTCHAAAATGTLVQGNKGFRVLHNALSTQCDDSAKPSVPHIGRLRDLDPGLG